MNAELRMKSINKVDQSRLEKHFSQCFARNVQNLERIFEQRVHLNEPKQKTLSYKL